MHASDNDRGNSHMCHDRPNKVAVHDHHQFEPLLSPLLVAKKIFSFDERRSTLTHQSQPLYNSGTLSPSPRIRTVSVLTMTVHLSIFFPRDAVLNSI